MFSTEKIMSRKKSLITALFLLLFVFVGTYNYFKPLPDDIAYTSGNIPLGQKNIEFLYDLSYVKDDKTVIHEQEIFDEIIDSIEQAEKYILIDMFLYNSWLGKATSSYRDLASELTDALLAKKSANPEISINLITDPINTVYGGSQSEEVLRLKESDIKLIITDLRPLRDSNPVYSSIWRSLFQWFGNDDRLKWVKHPFSDEAGKVSLRSYLSLLNFKANHRKIFLADSGNTFVSIITSANPHSSSSAHSNVAVKIESNRFAKELWRSEQAVAKMSGSELADLPRLANEKDQLTKSEGPTAKLLTEKKIKEALIAMIDETIGGEELNMAMFYLSDRDVIKALIRAGNRNVKTRLILDPNKDAFGYEKNGVPNRPVAHELIEKSNNKIKIRWYDTHGEQFHTKLTFANYHNEKSKALLGSANLTRRNIENFNLESNVLVNASSTDEFIVSLNEYFDKLWKNENDRYTLAYEEYADDSFKNILLYRFQEFSGLSSF